MIYVTNINDHLDVVETGEHPGQRIYAPGLRTITVTLEIGSLSDLGELADIAAMKGWSGSDLLRELTR